MGINIWVQRNKKISELYTQRNIRQGKIIKVLNVYPDIAGSNTLKT